MPKLILGRHMTAIEDQNVQDPSPGLMPSAPLFGPLMMTIDRWPMIDCRIAIGNGDLL
jgi:hypothetical protein